MSDSGEIVATEKDTVLALNGFTVEQSHSHAAGRKESGFGLYQEPMG